MGNPQIFCPDRRKRSVPVAVIEAYSGGHISHLVNLPAMENFFSFDLDKDGLISFEEAIVEDFKDVDVDNDGFVHPSEFDFSLHIKHPQIQNTHKKHQIHTTEYQIHTLKYQLHTPKYKIHTPKY